MAPQDQQAQLRQLLSQAQQRVPGMPGMVSVWRSSLRWKGHSDGRLS